MFIVIYIYIYIYIYSIGIKYKIFICLYIHVYIKRFCCRPKERKKYFSMSRTTKRFVLGGFICIQ